MAFELDEALDNAGNILKDLANAVKPDSDGGTKITLSELMDIITKNGINIVKDVQDDDYPDEPSE